MQVTVNRVVTIHYTLTDDSGTVLDQADAGQPLVYIHGAGNIIPGLEKALADKQSGDQVDVTIAPEDAYGERVESMVQTVPRKMFQGIDNIEPGMRFQADGNTGRVLVSVTKVEDDQVTIDGNHPLAGETLTFAVEIADVRDATAEELEHGHVHGPGCQH